MSTELIGKSFAFDLGQVKLNFTFNSVSTGTIVIVDGGGMLPDGHTETVEIDLKKIRHGLYLNSWTEASGSTVTHVEDYATSTLYATATIEGTLYRFVGTIAEL
jgi:hypothetical protein